MLREYRYDGMVMIKTGDKAAKLVKFRNDVTAEDEKDAIKKLKTSIEKEIKSAFGTSDLDSHLIRLFPKYLKAGAYVGE